jgi:hypothetical protein
MRSTLLACVSVCAVAAGCGQRFGRVEVSAGEVPENVRIPGAQALVDAYSPVRIAVHPLSRFEGSAGERRAVIDVELIDAYGHNLKWPGVLRIELSPVDSSAAAVVGWIDLTDGEANARVFDTISGCYAVRVPAPGSGGVRVRVRWLQGSGNGGVVAMNAEGIVASGR